MKKIEKRKIRVLLVLSRIVIGGAVNCVYFLAKHLPKEKYTIELVGGGINEGDLNMAEVLSEEGIKVYKIDSMKREISFKDDIVSVVKLYKLIHKIKPDIVFTHTAKAGAVGRFAAKLTGVPVILHTFHGHTFEHYFLPLKTSFYIFVERILARMSTRIIAISPSQVHDLAEKYNIAPPNKFRMIPIAVDISRFQNIKRDKSYSKSVGIPEDSFIIGMIARLVPIKNIPLIFKVMHILHTSGHKVHLLLVGDGEPEYHQYLETMCRDMGLKDYVHFTGWDLDVEHIYASMDLFVLTSLNEGTPVTILEAMAANIPVVSTDVGGVKDILLDNRNGLLCKSNDEKDMAEKILKIMNDKDLRTKVVKNGAEFVEQYYDYTRMVSNIDQLYTELINAKSIQVHD